MSSKYSSGSKQKDSHSQSKIDDAVPFIIILFIVGITVLIIRTLGFIGYIPSESMSPTVSKGDFIWVSKISHNFKRGDIIVFYSAEEDKLLVKRVIGMPGDTIRVDGDRVYCGDRLIHNYATSSSDIQKVFKRVPDNSYLFLGDNRAVSEDARYWDNPFIQSKDIKGKAIISLFPFHPIN